MKLDTKVPSIFHASHVNSSVHSAYFASALHASNTNIAIFFLCKNEKKWQNMINELYAQNRSRKILAEPVATKHMFECVNFLA